jgi:hypothetical protein
MSVTLTAAGPEGESPPVPITSQGTGGHGATGGAKFVKFRAAVAGGWHPAKGKLNRLVSGRMPDSHAFTRWRSPQGDGLRADWNASVGA